MEKYYTCKEIAWMYGVRVQTVWEWIKAGKLKAFRIGKLYRVSKDQLEEFEKNSQ